MERVAISLLYLPVIVILVVAALRGITWGVILWLTRPGSREWD